MDIKKLKNKSHSIGLGSTLIALGLIFIIVNPESMVKFIFYVIGGVMILNGIIDVCISAGKSTWGLITGVILLLIGFTSVFYPNAIAMTIVGALMIALPIIKAYFVKKGNTLKSLYHSMPFMILGLVLIFASYVDMRIAFIIFGAILILIGIYYLLPPRLFKPKHEVDKNNYIDVDAL